MAEPSSWNTAQSSVGLWKYSTPVADASNVPLAPPGSQLGVVKTAALGLPLSSGLLMMTNEPALLSAVRYQRPPCPHCSPWIRS